MDEYIINVSAVEDWQMINDVNSLDDVFQKARRVLVGGGTVVLVREQHSGESWRVGEYTNLEDFDSYKQNVYKYLKE